MNVNKIVSLYTKALHVDDAEVFLRKTDKQLWNDIRAELNGTTKDERSKIWEEKLEALVEKKYKSEPNAFVVKTYRGKSMYAETWRRKRVKAKWKFVNCFNHHAPKQHKQEVDVSADPATVVIRVKNLAIGGWDEDGILAGLENLYTRIPAEILDPLVERAKRRAQR